MLDSARRLRSQAEKSKNRRKPTGTRYSSAFRAEAVAHAHDQVRGGVAVARIARALGLRPKTLTLWMRRGPAFRLREVHLGRDPRPRPLAAPVAMPERRVVVVTGSGVRVEGLDLDSVVVLLRALA